MPSDRHSWLGFTTLYVALLLIPILLYIFVYQGSRIDEVTMRNFRSLDTAADRVKEVMKTMQRVAKNYSFGVDPSLLKDIIDSPLCKDTVSTFKLSEEDCEIATSLRKLIKVQQPDMEVSLDLQSVLIKPNCNGDRSDDKGCKASTESEDQCPFPLRHCRNAPSCDNGVTVSAVHLVSQDCRHLGERHRKLYDVLHPTRRNSNGKDSSCADRLASEPIRLIDLLDCFGIKVSVETSRALDGPTRHLSVFFDSYFVANSERKVIFAGGASADHDEYRRHRAEAPFVSFAEINDILSVEHGEDQIPLFSSPSAGSEKRSSDTGVTGHSTVRTVDVNNLELSVFVHPFSIDKSLSGDHEEISTWYIVGVLPRSSLAKEAIRIRLGSATDAMLAIALLLAVLPILRFWLAGDRSVLGRLNIYGIGASAIGAAALSTGLAWSIVSKYADNWSFEKQLQKTSELIHERFEDDIKRTVDVVEEDVVAMVQSIPSSKNADATGQKKSTSKGLKKSLLCNSVENDKRGEYKAMVLSSFLLNEEGFIISCTQYRRRQLEKLNLSFRSYFQDPYIGSHPSNIEGLEQWKRGPHVLEAIDSVVQGTKQIVISFALEGEDPERTVAAAVVRLPSIDNPVLEHQYRYAVVDRTGDTLFHSDDDRERVSNFFDDTGRDAKVQFALESVALKTGNAYTLETVYDGMPIQAHFRALRPSGEASSPWILIVYRHYRTIDVLTSLNVSLSTIAWTATTIVIFLLIAALVPVRRALGGRPILPFAVVVLVDGRVGVTALALSLLGLAISCIWSHHAWLVGILWPFLMVFVVYGTAWLQLWRSRVERTVGDTGRATLVVALVVLCLAVVPMLAWQMYFRGELEAGVERHLEVQARHDLLEAKRDYREYVDSLAKRDSMRECRFLWHHVVDTGRLPVKSAEEKCVEVDEDGGTPPTEWRFGWLRPLVAYSGLSDAIMRNSGRAEPTQGKTSVSKGNTPPAWVLVGAVFGGGLMILFLSYSAVRTKFGHARKMSLLPLYFSKERPMRMMLVKRSDTELTQFFNALGREYIIKLARWRNDEKTWRWERRETEDLTLRNSDKIVYVVEDLRKATTGNKGVLLAQELEALGEVDVILCSDVVPSYHISPGTLEDLDENSLMRSDAWLEVTRRFEVRTLCSDGGGCKGEGGSGCDTANEENILWRKALRLECEEHKDYRRVAEAVGKVVESLYKEEDRKETRLPRNLRELRCRYRESELRDIALRKFRAGALLRFKSLWAGCSYDERLQIIALARGGAPNIRQVAAISSLANRGIITTGDPIELRSKAFGDFVNDDLTHESLDEWRRQGHRDWWRVTWLPLVILAGLGLLFFLNSNPEAVGTLGAIGAALIAFVPVIASLLRVGQTVLPTGATGPDLT